MTVVVSAAELELSPTEDRSAYGSYSDTDSVSLLDSDDVILFSSVDAAFGRVLPKELCAISTPAVITAAAHKALAAIAGTGTSRTLGIVMVCLGLRVLIQ